MSRSGALLTFLTFLTCVGLLTWGALPYLPGQIDDAFIVFAYAHRIVESGEIAWNTGERVEGYSSAFHLFLMTLGAAAGADLAVAARAISWLCAVGVLFVLLRPRLGPGRFKMALAVAAWQAMQFWSVGGLETALATLIAVVAWPLVLGTRGQWAVGTLLCILLSLTRPEGAAWLLVALIRGFVGSRQFGRPEGGVVAGLAVLTLYHLLRARYFGALLPTPFLVKVEGIESWSAGWSQLGREALSAGAILGLVMLLRTRPTPWALVPMLIQASLLVRAGGDWMGHARFLLPGVLATTASVMVHAEQRGRVSTVLFLPVALLAVLGFVWEPASGEGGSGAVRNGWYLRHPLRALHAPWRTPMLEETGFLIERVPRGAGAYISDVGLPGNLVDVRIWDAAGLTDRLVAEVIAGRHEGLPPRLRARYEDDDDVWCMRYGLGAGGEETVDPWLQELLPTTYPSRSGRQLSRWRCRSGGEPTGAEVAARWQDLADRFPSQDWLRWHQARALLAEGAVSDALRVASKARLLGRDGAGWVVFGDGRDGSYDPGRGWALYANGELESMAAPYSFWRTQTLSLDVDDPGDEGARVRVGWDDGCSRAQEIELRGRAVFPLPPCDQFGRRRLSVEFLNDEARPGFDRNIYVSLVAR